MAAMPDVGPPLAERLKLSDDQMRRIRAIAAAGEQEIPKAASFPIPLDPKDKPTHRGHPQAGREPGIPGGQARRPARPAARPGPR